MKYALDYMSRCPIVEPNFNELIRTERCEKLDSSKKNLIEYTIEFFKIENRIESLGTLI